MNNSSLPAIIDKHAGSLPYQWLATISGYI